MMKTQMIILCLVLGSWGAYAQHNQAGHDESKLNENMAMFKDAKVGTAYQHYTQLKDALVASKIGEAKKMAGELQKALALAPGGKKASGEAAKIVASSNLDDQRKAFAALSNEMAGLVKGGKLSGGTIYVEYCPMANNHEGAYWLSNEKDIKNPYFGDKMLTCGSVKETVH